MKNEKGGCLAYIVLIWVFALLVLYFKVIYESALPMWLKWMLLG